MGRVESSPRKDDKVVRPKQLTLHSSAEKAQGMELIRDQHEAEFIRHACGVWDGAGSAW